MTDFWFFTALLLLLGMLVLVWPLWRSRQQQTVDRTALNVALYEERVAELKAQREQGDISAEQQQLAEQEASHLLLEDTADADAQQRPRIRGGLWQLVVPALLLPVAVLWLYFSWGNPEGVALQREFQHAPPPQSLDEYIDRMQRVVKVQPQSGEAWYMLARAYMNAGEPQQAADAFSNSLQQMGERPDVLAQMAQARYFAADNQLDTVAVRALERALELDEQEPTALSLLGIAAFEAEDYQGAIGYWTRLLASMPEDSEAAATIRGGIERAQGRLGIDPAASDEQQAAAEADGQAFVRVRVTLADSVLAQVDTDSVVFVFVRDPEGAPMPLVARRLPVSALPAEVELTNADAMLPGVTLQPGSEVEVIARLSPEGNVMQGSHQGQVGAVTVGGEDFVNLSIEQPLE